MKKATSSSPAPFAEVTIEAPGVCRHVATSPSATPDALQAISLVTQIEGINGASVIQWLERAVPAYEQARSRTALMGLAIGYVLLIVRDFTRRGTLASLKKMQMFGRSSRTLDRCIKLAQKFVEANGLTNDQAKLANPESASELFQSEFDFSSKDSLANPLLAQMASFVGDSSMSSLLDDDILGGDEPTPPNGHQDEVDSSGTNSPTTIKRLAFLKAYKAFYASFFAKEWECLYLRRDADAEEGKDCGRLDLEKFFTDALAKVKAYNKAEAKKERVKKPAKKAAKKAAKSKA